MNLPRGGRLLLLIAAALLACGCSSGRKVYPARGNVVFSDGKPVTAGRVEFESLDEEMQTRVNASGDIDKDGAFTLSTFIGGKEQKGAVEGVHRVIVVPPPPELTVDETRAVRSAIPARYGSYETSGIQMNVSQVPEQNVFTIQIERK